MLFNSYHYVLLRLIRSHLNLDEEKCKHGKLVRELEAICEENPEDSLSGDMRDSFSRSKVFTEDARYGNPYHKWNSSPDKLIFEEILSLFLFTKDLFIHFTG